MRKMNVAELEGVQLDYAVALCEGVKVQYWDDLLWYYNEECEGTCLYQPSEMWVIVGPTIERENITIERNQKMRGCAVIGFQDWYAIHPKNYGGLIRYTGHGNTPLIAAMRCYVASKLGDVVELPEELFN